MNWPHVHLMINHVPEVGMFGVVLILIYSLVRKSEEVKMLSFGLIVLIALMTIAVFLTGEAAQDTVKKLPGVTEHYIGQHEEVAELTLVVMEILGVAALAGLVFLRLTGSIPAWMTALVLILSLITAGLVGLTANLGGQIRHTEIRDATGPPASNGTMHREIDRE